MIVEQIFQPALLINQGLPTLRGFLSFTDYGHEAKLGRFVLFWNPSPNETIPPSFELLSDLSK